MGKIGIENNFTSEEIDQAQDIIIATDKSVGIK